MGQVLPPVSDVNTIPAAEVISESPHIGFEDRRRFVQAVLPENMTNANFLTFGMPISELQSIDYVYFYGVFDRAVVGGSRTDGTRTLHVYFDVDHIAAGYEDFFVPGNQVRFIWPVTDDMLPDRAWFTAADIDHPFNDMIQGERYFLKAIQSRFLHWQATIASGRFDPIALNSDDLWYIPAPVGEEPDFAAHGLSHIPTEIEIQNMNQRLMFITATADMSAMPVFQTSSQTFMLHDFGANPGRFITHEDHINKNPVAVISRGFARYHDLELGDTITLTLRDMQLPVIPFDYEGWRSYQEESIELTIVGFHRLDWSFYFNLTFRGGQPFYSSFTYPHIYIPLSILPEGFGGDESVLGMLDYSFVLESPRFENAFSISMGEALSEYGFEVMFFDHGARAFFNSIDTINLSLTVNLIAFSVVSLLVLSFACFVFLFQNRRVFAISRALGSSSFKLLSQKVVTAILFWTPFIVIGSMLAWNYATEQVESTLTPLVDMGLYESLIPLSLAQLIGFCVLFSALIIVFLVIGGLHAAKLPVLELLQERQKGGRNRAMRKPMSMPTQSTPTIPPPIIPGILKPTQQSRSSVARSVVTTATSASTTSTGATKLSTYTRFALRHTIRAPLKAFFIIITTIFFVSALIWLKVTIDNTQLEIETYLEAMPITATIRKANPAGLSIGFHMDEVIASSVMDTIRNDDFVRDAYVISAVTNSFIVPLGIDGEFDVVKVHEIWEQLLLTFHSDTVFRHTHLFTDYIFAVSSLETLIEETRMAQFVVRMGEPFRLNFAEGFSEDDFFYDDENLSSPIPVIVHEAILELRGIALGDIAYITQEEAFWNEMTNFSDTRLVGHHVQVIGTYSGHTAGGILHPADRPFVIMPLDAMRLIRGEEMTYITAILEIEPAKNYDIQLFEELHTDLLADNRPSEGGGFIPLQMAIYDDEFRQVILPMKENLTLLQILYPIVIAISVALSTGFALLLMLQNAKITALMRVLGSAKFPVRMLLSGKQLVLSLLGVISGLLILPIFNISYDLEILMLVGLLFTGAAVGTVIGALLISKKSPLELLQVRE
jgi:hypothetical protein